MTTNGSASVREETPHADRPTRTATISDALKQRAQAVLNGSSVDPQTRVVIRYALETNDPLLAELVLRAEAGETVIDSDGFLEKFGTDEES